MEAVIKQGKYIGRLFFDPLEETRTSTEAGATAVGISGAVIFAGAKATVGIAAIMNPIGLAVSGGFVLRAGFLAA